AGCGRARRIRPVAFRPGRLVELVRLLGGVDLFDRHPHHVFVHGNRLDLAAYRDYLRILVRTGPVRVGHVHGRTTVGDGAVAQPQRIGAVQRRTVDVGVAVEALGVVGTHGFAVVVHAWPRLFAWRR